MGGMFVGFWTESTSGLCQHAKNCWGNEAVAVADGTQDLESAHVVLLKTKLRDGSIMAEFEHCEREGILFALSAYFNRIQVSNTPLSKHISSLMHCECRAEIVHWVFQSKWPFKIVNNHGFCSLMKTGWLEYHIPSPATVSHDVRGVFIHVWKQIAKMLQVSMLEFLPKD